MGAFADTFAPLRNRNLRIYLGGQAISLIGTWMQATAQSWVVWKLSGSEAALGTVGMIGTLPLLLLGPVAGTIADRYDRRKILIYTQSAAAILACVLAILVQTNSVQLWHVYVLAGILGCVSALDMPSAQAFIGDMAGMDLVRRAVVVNGMIFQTSRILGPTLAGKVVALIGEAPAFWINGLSFLAVIASLLVVRANPQHRPAGTKASGKFMEGLRYAITQPRIFDLMILTALVTVFGFSNSAILPAFADKALHGGADMFGNLMAFSGAGALTSILFVVPWGQKLNRPGAMLAGAIVFAGLAFALFSLMRVPVLAMIAFYFTGIPIPLVLTTNNGLLQVMAPGEMRARLLTLYLMFSFGLQPISNLWAGWMANRIGAPHMILLNGACMAVFGGIMLLRPGLRAWEVSTGARPGGGPRPAQAH